MRQATAPRAEQDHHAMGNTLYEQDFHAWAMRQAELLRTGRGDCADLGNIAEEIESMGRSQRSELTNRLTVLLTHLLKWRFQPSLRGNSWRLTIKNQRIQLRQHMRDNPSLKGYVNQAVEDAWLRAAEQETGLVAATFPETCPFTFAQAMSDDFWPDV